LFHDRVRRAKEWAQAPQERALDGRRPTFREVSGEVDYGFEIHDPVDLGSGTRRYYVSQGSSASMDLADDSVDYIITDPPYYDSVQYSDLAAFFRVWLRQLLPKNQVLGINWDYAMKESAVRWKSGTQSSTGGDQYLQLLSKIFQECYRVLCKDFGRLVFSFHHWNPDGWAALTLALKRADFVLLNRFVVHSENPTSVHINNLRALTDDAIMVFASQGPRKSNQWNRPARIDVNSSSQFCFDCATLLGWILEAKLPETDIIQLWEDSIGLR
jgi:putative DNA methylase